jgi:ABC-2 type transport system permease protein
MTTSDTLTPPGYAAPQKVTQARVIRSELTKLRSLPSAAWCLVIVVAAVIGVGLLAALLQASHPPHGADAATFDPTAVSLSGVEVAMFAAGVLGVLSITGEYASGQVRATFTAVPRRLPVLWGKAAVLAGAVFTVSTVACAVAFGAGQSALAAHHLGTSLGQPGAVRAVLGSAVFLAAVALLGLGLGTLTRSTAGGAGALVGLLIAVSLISSFLPRDLSQDVSKYLPFSAGLDITTTVPDPPNLSPWVGLGLFALYAAAVLALAGWRIRRQEA